uniref:Uncharacterized protein n=1 Tax=Bursaphelenchus xylophilus TaxID=6326 RepID=A0A1I7SU69_BURXY
MADDQYESLVNLGAGLVSPPTSVKARPVPKTSKSQENLQSVAPTSTQSRSKNVSQQKTANPVPALKYYVIRCQRFF